MRANKDSNGRMAGFPLSLYRRFIGEPKLLENSDAIAAGFGGVSRGCAECSECVMVAAFILLPADLSGGCSGYSYSCGTGLVTGVFKSCPTGTVVLPLQSATATCRRIFYVKVSLEEVSDEEGLPGDPDFSSEGAESASGSPYGGWGIISDGYWINDLGTTHNRATVLGILKRGASPLCHCQSFRRPCVGSGGDFSLAGLNKLIKDLCGAPFPITDYGCSHLGYCNPVVIKQPTTGIAGEVLGEFKVQLVPAGTGLKGLYQVTATNVPTSPQPFIWPFDYVPVNRDCRFDPGGCTPGEAETHALLCFSLSNSDAVDGIVTKQGGVNPLDGRHYVNQPAPHQLQGTTTKVIDSAATDTATFDDLVLPGACRGNVIAFSVIGISDMPSYVCPDPGAPVMHPAPQFDVGMAPIGGVQGGVHVECRSGAIDVAPGDVDHVEAPEGRTFAQQMSHVNTVATFFDEVVFPVSVPGSPFGGIPFLVVDALHNWIDFGGDVVLALTIPRGTVVGDLHATAVHGLSVHQVRFTLPFIGGVAHASGDAVDSTGHDVTFNVGLDLAFDDVADVAVGGSFTVTVRHVDGNGNPITDPSLADPITLELDGPGTLSGTLTQVPVNGVAVFPSLSIDTAGPNDLLARGAGINYPTFEGQSNTFGVT